MEIKSNFYFENGYLYVNKIPCLLCPINTVIIMYDYLSKNHPEILIKQLLLLKQISYKLSLYEIKTNKKPSSYQINNILITLNSLGLGKIELVRKDTYNKKFLFKCENPLFSSLSEKLLKNTKFENNTFDFFTQYFLEGLIEAITKRKVTTSSFKKARSNYFEYKVTDKKIIEDKLNNKFFEIKKIKINTNPVIKRILVNNQLKNKEGILHIWRMNVIALPLDLFELSIINNNEKIKEEFKLIGETQGKAAFQIMAELFGSKENPLKIFENVCYQTELIGVGKTKLKKFDIENKKIQVEFTEDVIFKNNKLTLIGIYLLGIFNEVLENIFDKEFIYEIKANKNILLKSTNKKYIFNTKKLELSKYMGISAITKISNK